MNFAEKMVFNITLIIFGIIFYTLGATIDPRFLILGGVVNIMQLLFILLNMNRSVVK